MKNGSQSSQTMTEAEYKICLAQCNGLKETSNFIVEMAQKLLKAPDGLNEAQQEQLNAINEAGYDLMNIIDKLLELDSTRWNYELIGALRNELSMRANFMTLPAQVLLENLFGDIPAGHQATLNKMRVLGEGMLVTIPRLGNYEI